MWFILPIGMDAEMTGLDPKVAALMDAETSSFMKMLTPDIIKRIQSRKYTMMVKVRHLDGSTSKHVIFTEEDQMGPGLTNEEYLIILGLYQSYELGVGEPKKVIGKFLVESGVRMFLFPDGVKIPTRMLANFDSQICAKIPMEQIMVKEERDRIVKHLFACALWDETWGQPN